MVEKTIRKNNFENSFDGTCLTGAHVSGVLSAWDSMRGGRFGDVDSVLTQLFGDPDYSPERNGEIVKKYVYLRCYLVDAIYGTQLKEGFNTAVDNIARPGIESRILEGDVTVLDDIKTVYSTRANDHTKDSLSFASKYCFRLNPESYPIYDSVVKEMLVLINEKTHFYGAHLKVKDIESNYAAYKRVVDAFISAYSPIFPDGACNYDLFDKYLWTWGKQLGV